MPELTIKHTTKSVRGPAEAGVYGFAEGFGNALGYAVVFFACLWALAEFLPNDDETGNEPPTEQY